jgi:polyphosphate kinase 2 (PPK2 family)
MQSTKKAGNRQSRKDGTEKGSQRPPVKKKAAETFVQPPEFADLEKLLKAQHPKGGLTHSVSLQIAHEKGHFPYAEKISSQTYEQEKRKLQAELLKVQSWVRETGQRVVGLFEGRDAAGKGGTI